ncbi:MAG: hypothetical protein QOE45_3024 [Frankiaceae bacterium]|jgi:hypothetical protein|nr:hypothetical protein [Frankiaceae bacterium]
MTLTEVRTLLAEFAAGFDASLISATDAAALLTESAKIERIAGALTAVLAARAADAGAWRAAGARSAAHRLAEDTGTSIVEAQRVLDTGRRLDRLPAVAAVAAAGDLSAPQLAAVADAASCDPASAPRLLGLAARGSLAELRDECRRTKAAVDRDAEARRRRIHDERALRTWTDVGDVGNLLLRDTVEVIAEVKAAIVADRERLFREARRDRRRERPEALDADALLAVVRRGADAPIDLAERAAPDSPSFVSTTSDRAGSDRVTAHPAMSGRGGRRARRPRSAAKILVRVDLDTLLRGYPTGDEVCEVAGSGPVPVSAVSDLLGAGGFLAGVVTRGHRVAGVAHLGRRPTAFQDTALEWLYPTCAAEGCGNRIRLEKDHRLPWAESRITLLDLLDRLCAHHHALKTRRGWGLTPGHGSRPFVPPTDPRHPRNGEAGGRAPPV